MCCWRSNWVPLVLGSTLWQEAGEVDVNQPIVDLAHPLELVVESALVVETVPFQTVGQRFHRTDHL